MTDVSIGMLIFPDFQLLDVAGPLELFQTTSGLHPLLIGETAQAVSAFGLPGVRMTPDCTFDNAPHCDVLFVPGGLGVAGAIESTSTRHFLASRASDARYRVKPSSERSPVREVH